jgi:hypothetical protein
MRIVLSAATTLLAIIALMTPASADVMSNDTVPINLDLLNPCNGEMIRFTGEEHMLFRLAFDQNGGTHLGFTQNARSTGQGLTTGATYTGNFTNGGSVSTTLPLPFSFTVVSHQNFLSQGKNPAAPDFLLHETLSIAVDVDGNFSTTLLSMRTTCQ